MLRTESGFLKSVIKTQLLLLSKINDNNFFILGIFQELDIHSTDLDIDGSPGLCFKGIMLLLLLLASVLYGTQSPFKCY